MHLRFQCTHSLAENGILEHNHRSIKTITARKIVVLEAVYWYNLMPKDDISPSTSPADILHKYHVQIRGIEANPLSEPQMIGGGYEEGDVDG